MPRIVGGKASIHGCESIFLPVVIAWKSLSYWGRGVDAPGDSRPRSLGPRGRTGPLCLRHATACGLRLGHATVRGVRFSMQAKAC